ncbi:murein hydrolase activator EnvC family protein [Vaginella massiliensis]|uniref:murein hydrolase activator EnvC family protein n=1 Tax=Vaginella massiliensis TaxID=1816680 RepID=UPI003753D8E1
MNDQKQHIIPSTHTESKTKVSAGLDISKVYRIIILALSVVLISALFYYTQIVRKNIHQFQQTVAQNDSLIADQKMQISKLERANKNLELYNRDLTNQKKFYDDLKPFQQKNILPLLIDIESREEQTLKEIEAKNKKNNTTFVAPVEGFVSGKFNKEENHIGLDIVSKSGEPVKVIADGTVIFTDWTPETGFVILVDHHNSFISVYKHNLDVFKKMGEKVKQGEVISSVGNTGELSTGPHLHLELWLNGNAVDPQKYIPLNK